jgi:hypothetical protein
MTVPLVMFATTGPLTRNEVVTYAISDEVAPQRPHRSRLVLPPAERDADLDALIVHELTPANFDAAFRQDVERRFAPVAR